MRRPFRLLLGAVTVSTAIFVLGCSAPAPEAADLVVTHGRVYSLAWGEPAPDGTPAPDAPRDSAGWRPDAGRWPAACPWTPPTCRP